ncbi:tetratricopeptide repeat protein [Engelhardtia mirabilis]|uniref:TPR repeat-containing protein YrrB n=1 Tax=Engelhardtia mirabilis TaxID=2528011 RepID=A0A518BQA7_9BACT|nr:TPR repeat-containing protein YrrB [Planctomycetes bacterium Pla133]QDV03475.1 TPR repeat-containing protein YrrB [Planctomycetes bacterium Pla86]
MSGEPTSGVPDECRQALERALVDPPEGDLERESALIEASESLRAALDRDPMNLSLWLLLGEIELLRDDHEGAERAYRRAMDLDPVDTLGHSGLAHTYASMGRAEEAEELLDEALGIDASATLYAQLGTLHLEQGDLESAEKDLRAGLDLDPDDEQILFLLARFFARDDEEATQLLERAVEVDPGHVFAWLELGTLRAVLGNDEGARSCFQRVVALEPESSDGYRELARIALADDAEEATTLARRAIELDGDDVGAWTVLGRALTLAGKRAEAERTLLSGCAIRPLDVDGARAHVALAEFYRESGRLEDALGALQAVEGFAHMEPGVAALLGRLYSELGRSADARAWLQVALEHDIDDIESRDLLRELRGD